MYSSVQKVAVHQDYQLIVLFDNGEQGILEMKPFLDFGVFQKLKDGRIFNQVRVAFDTIEREGGIDLDPEFVYDKCQGKQFVATEVDELVPQIVS